MFRLHQHHRSNDSGSAAVRRASRSRWAAIGAAVAVSIGAGSIGVVGAAVDTGERPILVQIEPCRLLDTRLTSPIGAGETLTVDAHGINGDCDLPVEASGLSLNVTAVQASEQTNVRIFPDANSVPTASNLNPGPGNPPAPNAVTTQLDGDGAFSIFNEFGTVGIIIDVNGYYEDHNHDDRYVQQTDMMWAVVRPNGELARSSDGVIASLLVLGDRYLVTFDEDINECAYQATVGRRGPNSTPPAGFAQVSYLADGQENVVVVFTNDSTGTQSTDLGFHLLVTC